MIRAGNISDLKYQLIAARKPVISRKWLIISKRAEIHGQFSDKYCDSCWCRRPRFHWPQLSDTPVDKRTGYILGGGKVIEKYVIGLVLGKADFELTNSIRNASWICVYGNQLPELLKAGMIEVTPPDKYGTGRGKFIELIKATLCYDIPQNDQERIN